MIDLNSPGTTDPTLPTTRFDANFRDKTSLLNNRGQVSGVEFDSNYDVQSSYANLGSLNLANLSESGTVAGTFIRGTVIDAGTVSAAQGTFNVLTGTFTTGGTLSFPLGTIDALTYGTATGNRVTFGTLFGTTGTINTLTGTLSSGTITGQTAFSGTLTNSGLIDGGTISSPNISGTPILAVNSGTAQLAQAGNFAIQTKGGSALLVARIGGTTYFFTPAGTH